MKTNSAFSRRQLLRTAEAHRCKLATVRVICTDGELIDGTAGLACLSGYYFRLKETV